MIIALLLAVAAAAASAPLNADQQADLACVVTLARARPVPAGAADYAATVGAAIMDATGRTREQVRDLMLAEAKRPAAGDVAGCTRRMRARAAAEAIDDALPVPARSS